MEKGRVTLPSEENYYDETMAVAKKWKADAIRDSDGTKLDKQIKNSGLKIYNAYFPTRAHNDFIQEHMEECPQIYLMSDRILSKETSLTIAFMKTYYPDQLVPNYRDNPKKYWEVIDRTTGEVIDASLWTIDQEQHRVMIKETTPWHEYTVSFLAYIIWDPVEMYNHLTNDWGDKEHEIPFDALQPHSHQFILDTMKSWLKDNPEVDVVRFTTFFYQFSLVFNHQGKEKFVDWFGYGASVSPKMLARFEETYGYSLTAEDFVDEGYYNSSFRIPNQRYKDYMSLVQAFVVDFVAELTEMVHEAGKEAMMFLGDQWIGAEPYGPLAEKMKLDAVVGSVGDGTTLRMISDIPHVDYTEGRFLPYFFPDTFYEGNDPSIEAMTNWVQARRAILRSPIQRMGYGGYLSLANKFPKFIDTVAMITEEFRMIHTQMNHTRPYSGLKVAILNHWGKLRTWQAFTVAHALYSKEAYSYYGVLESLSGMNVDVSFISFEDILNHGIDPSIDVIINAGLTDTAFSGGKIWTETALLQIITEWGAQGGGFIGIGESASYPHQGRFFQLAHVLGVEKERGLSLSSDKYFKQVTSNHFITESIPAFKFGETVKSVYALSEETKILEYSEEEVHLACHEFGKGRSVYLAGLPFDFQNARLLMRCLYYAANKEDEIYNGYAENIYCEVSLFPEVQRYCVINNSAEVQTTNIYLSNAQVEQMTLQPYEMIWSELDD